jgi:hypothetical protein
MEKLSEIKLPLKVIKIQRIFSFLSHRQKGNPIENTIGILVAFIKKRAK